MKKSTRTLLWLSFTLVPLISACGSAETESAPSGAGGSAGNGTPDEPGPLGKADSVDKLKATKSLLIIGNELTVGDSHYDVSMTCSSTTQYHLLLNSRVVATAACSDGTVAFSPDISSLPAGRYAVTVRDSTSSRTLAATRFYRIHPYYVFVSNDWDTPDFARTARDSTESQRLQDALHDHHPAMMVTQFVGPYTFTDPTVSESRKAQVVGWLKDAEARGDEIGLHIHPYCNFVEAAGLTCQHTPNYHEASAGSGYTVNLSGYSEEQTLTMLKKADELFLANGFAKPTSFRAGGWTAEIHTLRALAADGFVVDASGSNWKWLTSWKGVAGASLYEWNSAHWAPINDTSQPYYPSTTDMLSKAAPVLPLLEVPDNGCLADYVTAEDMINIFNANYTTALYSRPVVLSIGYHGTSFTRYYDRLESALRNIDDELIENGGAVQYIRGSDIPRVIKSN
ncbi:MAG: DUF2334 domain-containing protein [Polyangiaceae bacterium]|jgi:predicted deacetylase|nr:DUF2334 domain-containing protein [Polyangiaceae bacterium]